MCGQADSVPLHRQTCWPVSPRLFAASVPRPGLHVRARGAAASLRKLIRVWQVHGGHAGDRTCRSTACNATGSGLDAAGAAVCRTSVTWWPSSSEWAYDT
jgi:hypothetical protein